MPTLFSSRRFINKLSAAILLAFLGSVVFYGLIDPDQLRLFHEGDFTDFYAVAHILKDGQAARLYDFGLQKEIQAHYWSTMSREALYFRYPPFVALFLWPLAFFGPALAKGLFVSLMIVCLIAACRVASSFALILKTNWLATAAALTLCAPISISVIAGQNSALLMLLFAGIVYGLTQRTPVGEILVGAAAGLMLFKPQFGVIWCLWLGLLGSRRIIFSIFGVASFYYLFGVFVYGWTWPVTWLQATAWAVQPILRVDQNQMISFYGFFNALAALFPKNSLPANLLAVLGLILSGLLFLSMAHRFLKLGQSRLPDQDRQRHLENLLLLAGPASLLVSPHTMFYDFGICLFATAKFFDPNRPRHITGFILVLVVVNLSMMFRETLPGQPLTGITLLAFLWVWKRSSSARGLLL